MFVSGDEARRTQGGNNNAYCQDNEIGWFDWTLLDKHHDLYRFWKRMIEFRKSHAALRTEQFFTGATNDRGLVDVTWHGTQLDSPAWTDPETRALALTLAGFNGDADIHVMLNMYWDSLEFELPAVPGRRWFQAVDTSATPPNDIADPGAETEVTGATYAVQGRSVVVLVNRAQA
jgi:glycogen operon protein